MKKVGVVLTALFTVSMSAQTHELVKHNGEKKGINYSKTEHNLVCFSNTNSLEESKISKYAVQSIIDKVTGSIQIISSKIDVKDKDGFRDVLFLKESETMGLRKGETISVFFGRTKGFSDYDLVTMKKRRLQEKAAQKGSPFLVITSELYDETKAVLYYY
jgi:hypothetical protein|nr:hypothetical protein [uncultured Flavobacterium sp.]